MIFRRLERRLDAGVTPLPRGRRVLEGSQHRGERRRTLGSPRPESPFQSLQNRANKLARRFERFHVRRRQRHGPVQPHRPARIDLGVKELGVDAPSAEQDDRLALDQALQIPPVDARDLADLGRAGFGIFARPAALIARRLGHIGLAGRVLDPLPGAIGVLLPHRDRQVGVAEQRLRLFPEPRPDARDFLKAEPEHEVEAPPHGEHAVHAARRVIGDLVEDDMEGRRAHPRLVGDDSLRSLPRGGRRASAPSCRATRRPRSCPAPRAVRRSFRAPAGSRRGCAGSAPRRACRRPIARP